MTDAPKPPEYPPYPPAGPYPFGSNAPYGYPGYPGVPVPPPAPRNGVGTAALIVGILAVLFSCTIIGGLIGGIAAVILGAVGLSRVKRAEADNRGVAISGLALGGVAVLLSAAMIAFTVVMLGSMGFGDYFSCISNAHGDQSRIDQCQAEFYKRVEDSQKGSSPSQHSTR